MPAFQNHTGRFGVPNAPAGMPVVKNMADGFTPYFEERNLQISGVTKDSTGAVLGNCVVRLFDVSTWALLDTQISDANGNYTFVIPKGLSQQQVTTWQGIAYKTGSPDVAGATVNTLAGA
jgi:hypothetical protein